MDYFTIEGQWWLPDNPGRRVPGTLTFDADGLELVLHEALRQLKVSEGQVAGVIAPEWTADPIVHGRARDGREFTLFEVGGANMVGPFSVVREVYRPELALAGSHAPADQFAEARYQFDYLDAWSDPPPIVVDDGPEAARVRLAPVDLATTRVPNGTVRLVSGVEGTSGSDRVQLTRWTAFAVAPTEPRTAKELIDGFGRPLQDLLLFCLGRPVRLTSLRLVAADQEARRRGPAEAFFAAVQPVAGRPRTSGEVDSYSAPTILSAHMSPIPLDRLLSRWFDLWARRREVLVLLLAPLYAPFMYGEHGFASTFQSAELLHDLELETRDVSKADHRARVDAVVQALESARLNAATIEWVSKMLTSRNDKPLARRIEDLVKSTGSVGVAVLEADPNIGATSAAVRTGVSHGGAERALDPVGRYWYGQVLRWVVRARLLADLIDDSEEAQRRVVARSPFRRALKEIGVTGTSGTARP